MPSSRRSSLRPVVALALGFVLGGVAVLRAGAGRRRRVPSSTSPEAPGEGSSAEERQGPVGPTGPAGPTGARGPAGATGVQGPAGASGEIHLASEAADYSPNSQRW